MNRSEQTTPGLASQRGKVSGPSRVSIVDPASNNYGLACDSSASVCFRGWLWLPTRPVKRVGLLKGAAFMRSISADGGYLWRYSKDLQLVAGEKPRDPIDDVAAATGHAFDGYGFLETTNARANPRR